MAVEIINAPNAPAAIGPYSHGTKCGDIIFTSGQCPFYPGTGEVERDVKKATALALNNVLAVVEAGGGKKTDIAKVEIFVRDLANFGTINEVYAEFFTEPYPARAAFQAAGIPKGALVEIECVAVKG